MVAAIARVPPEEVDLGGLASLWNRLRSTYWFVPSLLTAAAVGLAVALVTVDTLYPDLPGPGWLYSGGADGAQALLSAVAGSMITVVSVTFSVTVVALTVSSQHFGPRLLNSFMRDAAAQLVLGTFIGTFAYCVVVLRTVHGGGDGFDSFVPHLAITAAVVLTLLSVAMLIYYIHHVSASLQVAEIARGVASDLDAAIDRIYPEPIGSPDEARAPVRPQGEGTTVRAVSSGYVQEIDGDALLRVAADADVVVWVVANPGAFVFEGAPLAIASPSPRDADVFARRLRRAFMIGSDRTARQDAAFAVRQLVEVALHALSPGINEPFTALTCIDRLGQGLVRLVARAMPAASRDGPDGRIRVVAEPRTFPALLDEAFTPIRVHTGTNVAVGERLLAVLQQLGERARRPGDLAAIRSAIEASYESCAADVKLDLDRDRLRRARLDALGPLGGAWPDPPLQ